MPQDRHSFLSRKRFWVLATMVVFVASWGLANVNMVWQTTFRSGDPEDSDQVEQGLQFYENSCARCHGNDLRGEFGEATAELATINDDLKSIDQQQPVSDVAPAHDATGGTWRHSDQTLFEIVKFGGEQLSSKSVQSRMPAFAKDLTDDQIWSVIAFIKSHWPHEVRELQNRANLSAGERDAPPVQ